MSAFSKIRVVGNFGYANHDLNGQTVKTRVVYDMLRRNADDVGYFDTQTLCRKREVFSLLNKVVHCKTLVYLPAHGNLKYLFPLYYILSRVFRFEIVYCVIGGWLVEYLKTKPLHRYMLKRIKCVLAETHKMQSELTKQYNFKNVDIMDNFRITDFIPTPHAGSELKLVFMARINPKKGLDTILNFCDYVDALPVRPNISVSFFGPLTQGIGEQFLKSLDRFDFVEYYGEIEPENIYSTLTGFDVMLLPTHFYTEGLPGTIIDAYLSGLPVVVSEWLHAREFVADGKTGYIVPFEDHQEEFNKAIMSLYEDREQLSDMKKQAVLASNRFKEDTAWSVISKYIR